LDRYEYITDIITVHIIMSRKSSSLWHIKVLLCLGALPSHIAFSPSTSLTSSRLNDSSLIYKYATDYNKKRGRIRRISNTNLYDTPQQTEEPFFMQDVDNDQNYDNDIMNAQQEEEVNGSSNSGGMDAYTQQMEQFATAQDDVSETQIESPPPPPVQNEYTTTTNTNTNNNEPAISNVDARVLESILQDGKLDLSSEYEVKKLLEGPRLQDNEDYPTTLSDEEQKRSDKYNSNFVKSVSDNAFWNSIKAKGEEIIDSAAIYIANRIERDTKTLAAVGLFTFDRIRKDIGRALPAAGRATRQLLLSSNSTYAEKLLDVTDQTPFALPSERSLTNRDIVGSGYDELYEDLTTPADEIRSVTSAILDILSGKEIDYDQSSSARRSVKSFAPAGTSRMAERQKRAYKARKQTVLKREKEGIDRKVGRAIGSVSDATWEFRREMQTAKGREAGYRSKGVRKALASGATQLLEAGRESSRRLLSNGSESSGEQQVEIVNDDNFVVEVTPMEEEEIIENVIEEMTLDYAPDGLLSPQSYVEEKRRLISSLESCLSQPSETWLTKEAVAEAAEYGVQLDGDILREVITNMVTLRDQLQKEMEEIANEQVDLKMEFVQTDLRRMKQMVDSVSSLSISAAGQSAANLLKQELEGFVLSDTIDDIIEIELERLEQLLAEEVAAREEEIRAQRQRQQQKLADQQRYMDTVVESEVVDQSTTASQGKWNGGMYTEVEVVNDNTGYQGSQDYQTSGSGSRVEVVSDTEYTEYEQQFKSAQSVVGDEVDMNEDQEDNPVADLALRVLDVIFFIGEKVFLVLLPDLITGGGRVTSRYAQAQNRGRGSVGWKQLQNIKTKNIR